MPHIYDAQPDSERRASYGRSLRRQREALDWSQKEAADASETTQALVSKAEQGIGTEETFRALEYSYRFRDAYPSAPKDPLRRREYFDYRTQGLAKVKPPKSGTFGKVK